MSRKLLSVPSSWYCIEEHYFISEDLSRLHKILKDDTRVKTLELLNNRDSLSYSEQLSQSGITNTGRMNYHLKILGDLITKDEKIGNYSLSEKGKLDTDNG